MQNVEITKHGDFQVATAQGQNGFTAWAKMGAIQTDCPIKEPGAHVWFNFGRTREEARNRVLDELGLTLNAGSNGPIGVAAKVRVD